MATSTWTHAHQGWADSGAWSPATPGAGDVALFDGDLFHGDVVGGSAVVGAARVLQDGPTFTGTITLAGTSGVDLLIDDNGVATFASGGELATGGLVVVGQQHAGTLELDGQAGSVHPVGTSGGVVLGVSPTSSAVAEVTGGAWEVAGNVVAGRGGSADLAISGGGALFVGGGAHGNLDVGQLATATGVVAVTGPGSEVFVSGTANVGQAGAGLLSLSAQGYLSAGTLVVGATGAVSLADGYLRVAGTATVAAGADVGGSGAFSAAALRNDGTVTARGFLSLSGAVSGGGALAVATGATMVLTQDVLARQRIAFLGPRGTLILERDPDTGALPAVAAAVAGFRAGDLLLVEGTTRIAYAPKAGTLTLYDGGSTQERLHVVGVAAGSTFAIVGEQGGLARIALLPPHP